MQTPQPPSPTNNRKRPRLTIDTNSVTPARDRLPCVVSWPEDLGADGENAVADAYFDPFARPGNLLELAFTVAQYGAKDDPYTALQELKQDGVFATAAGRAALSEVIRAARSASDGGRTFDLTENTLDTLERYTHFAFSVEDGSVGCGEIPAEPIAYAVCC